VKSYNRPLSLFLAFHIAFMPLYGVAADLSVDANAPASQQPILDRAGNNVPIVQITRPTGAGVSMNRYGNFNIGEQGLILNNASQITQTQLGGYVEGNPNLRNSAGASLIVNQVGGGFASELRGYAEVAGRSADVVIANPNGITCDGCGFINTPRGMLTTGVTGLRGDGSLGDIRVIQGLIKINGKGINAANTDRLDLLARAIEVNADLYAQDLNLVTGSNTIDYGTLGAEAIKGEGLSPGVALDVSGVGGMYANRIFMVGTEKGLGVNSEGVIATFTGDLQLSADGTLRLGTTHSSGSTAFISTSSDIAFNGQASSDDSLSAKAQGTITINGSVGAQAKVDLSAGTIVVNEAGQLYSGFDSTGARTGNGELVASSVQLTNAGQMVGRQLAISSDSLKNTGDLQQLGEGSLTLDITELLDNKGQLAGNGNINISAAQIDNKQGSIKANGRLELATQAFTYEGEIDAASIGITSSGPVTVNSLDDWQTSGDLQISTSGVINLEGKLQTAGNLKVDAAGLFIGDQGLASAQGNADVNLSGTLENRNRLSSAQNLSIEANRIDNYKDLGARRATVSAGRIANRGLFFGLESLNLNANVIENQVGGLWGLSTETAEIFTFGDLTLEGRNAGSRAQTIRNQEGVIRAEGDITINTDSLENLGDWISGGTVTQAGSYQYSQSAACFSDPRTCMNKYERTFRTRTVKEVALVEGHSPASLIAGGRLAGHATNLTNLFSYIGAGDSITLEGDVLNNTAAVDDVAVSTTRWGRYWKRTRHGWGTKTSRSNRSDDPVTIGSTETVTLAGATIESTGDVSLNFSGEANNGTLAGHVTAVRQAGLTDTPDMTALGGSGTGSLNGQVVDPTAQDSFHLPDGSGLFVINNNPDHPYLVETNPLLTDYARFTSSDYLLERLGWDGAQYMRRIGDGFYELTLVEQSLQTRTGSRFVSGQSGMAMFQQLMDNAVIAKNDLNLAPGVALTKGQINRLTRSMVWMETRKVDGQNLLVPVVYLASEQDLAYDNGALIAGRNVSITGDSGVANAGVINALDALTITSKQGGLTNREGRLKAERQVSINVARNIVNQSGAIKGAGVRMNAGGDIRNETLVNNVGSVDRYAVSRKGQDASIVAGNTLVMNAAGDVLDQAGKLEAGENIAIAAGGDIRFNSQQQVMGFNVGDRNNNQSLRRTENLTSSVNAGSDLALNAGNDIAIRGAQIAASNNADLKTEGDINVFAVADVRHSELHYREKGGAFGSRKKLDSTSDSLVHKGASVTAGGNLAVSSGNNLQVTGSKMQGGDNVRIEAGGDIQLTAAVDQQQESVRKTEKNSVRRKDEARGYHRESAVGALVASGGDLRLNSAADIQITGSDLVAGERLQIGESLVERTGEDYKTANGDNVKNLTVDTVALNNEEWAEKSRSFSGVMKAIVKVAAYTIASVMGVASDSFAIEIGSREADQVQQISHQGSALAANDITVNVNDAARFEGANVSAAGHLTMDANTIQIDAVANTTSETHVSEKETIKGLGAKLEQDEFRVGGIEERKDQSTQTLATTQWQGSQISAANIELNAGDSIQVTASDVASTGDMNLQAGNSIQVSGRQDTQTTTDSQHTEIRTTSAGIKNAYVDAAYALKAMDDARQAVNNAKKALSEAKDKVAQGKVREQDLKYYQANLAAATANLAHAGIAFVAAGATAATTTGTGGFYATGSTERTTLDSSRTEQMATWNGSQLVAGGNASLNSGEDIGIKGSDVAANGTLAINSNNVNIVAGTDTRATTSSSEETNQGITVSYGAQGLSGSVSAGYRNADSDGSNLTYRNSTVSADEFESTSKSLTVAGAEVAANTINIDTDTLNVRSLQNQSSSQSKTRGANAGLGVSNGAVSSVSAGVERANGSSDRTWTDNQTRIIGRDSVTVNAKDTVLTGAVMANATTDANGQLVDQGNLSLTTDTLTVANLSDTDRSENRGFNASVSVNVSGQPRNEKQQSGPQTGQTTVGGHYNGHDRAQTTHATLGQGQMVVAGTEQDAVEGLNRDLGNRQEMTRDQEIGGLDASVTVDHRLLSSEGRDSIVNDAVDTFEHGEDIVRSGSKVGNDKELTVLNFGEVLHNNAQGTQLKNDLLRNPENAHILAGLKSKNPEEYAQAVSDLGHLAQEKFGLSLSDINLYDAGTTESASLADSMLGNVKGGVVIDPSSPLFGKIFVDAGDGASKTDMTFTLGHEVLETQSLQGKDGRIFGSNSEQAQEALGDAFGEQLASRINQAAGGNLDATGGSYFSAGLTQSHAVRNGTVKANQVGSATVDHRQLYVQEARAILDNAPAYAKTYEISETQAKKELIQQALLMVDKGWADQTHITENDRARQTLESIAAAQSDKAQDVLTRTPFNQVVHQNESDYFQADEAAYNDSDLNAAEATAIEAGWAGEDNVLSRYATEHGQKPLDVAFGDSASQLGVNARQKAEALYGAITNDPLGLVVDTVNGAYESVVTCVTTSTCIAPDQTHGTARDRQLVAELQGNAGAAIAEAADHLGTTLVELTAVPGVGKAAKSGVVGLADTAVEQARKNARKDISPGSLGTKKNLNFSSAQLSAAKELGVDPKWINSDGRINWPGNRGFDGTPEKITVEPGAKFDRYGGYYENNKFLDTGKFVSPEGTPFDQRALPNKTLDKPYTRYEVIKPIHGADSGKVASWFDKPGGGTQIDLPMSIGELVEGGFIRPLIKR
jgi:filamentous hemagglutinin family protein